MLTALAARIKSTLMLFLNVDEFTFPLAPKKPVNWLHVKLGIPVALFCLFVLQLHGWRLAVTCLAFWIVHEQAQKPESFHSKAWDVIYGVALAAPFWFV